MITIESYRDTHATAVAMLFDRIPELPSTSEKSFRSFAAMAFNRGARDFLVARDGTRIVALLTSTVLDDASPSIRHFRVAVDPAYRRRGIGRRLLSEVEVQGEAPILQCNSQRSWATANEALERAGFHVAHTEHLMRLEQAPPSLSAPPAFTVRKATESDDSDWMALHRRGYGHREDFFPLEPADLVAERGRPGFVLLLAERDKEPIGLCHGLHHDEREGLINSVVVAPEHRRQGIGAALVLAVIGRLRASRPVVTLNVQSTNTPAIGLYKQIGFTTYDEILTCQRRVPEALSCPTS
ncbi:MAG: GNAT family N-acetyltransferase [Nannocystaceae bacterium]|nr:GNAT family N-acetyltransferase [Nannocystaceae bacterium]